MYYTYIRLPHKKIKFKNILGRFCFMDIGGYILNINQYHYDKEQTNKQEHPPSGDSVRGGC
jgi:hypothetical protein